MTAVPRVVVVGAGIVGAALADELSARGWTDVTVLDQGPLFQTGGSTSHAPGGVFQVNPSKTMTEFAQYTVDKLTKLSVNGQPCFLPVGGLEIATTDDRARDLQRRHGWLTSWGVESWMLDGPETVKAHSLLDPKRVLAGLFVPTDGIAKPVRAVEAQARLATDRGVRFRARHEVLDIRVVGGRVAGVVTDQGEIPADVVVCCAGIWGPRVARMVGLPLPLTPLAHQLAWTTPLPALAGMSEEAVRPMLRHQGSDLYYREFTETLAVGWYGHQPMPVDPDDIAGFDEAEEMPSVRPFTPADFAPAWEETRRVIPATREGELVRGINGMFSFTPDGMPLMGESPDVAGFWVAEAVWITHSAGVARAVAEWLVDGEPGADLHECDLSRFEAHQLAPAYIVERGCQNYVEVYDAIHPQQPMESPRPLRTSPFHPRHLELGGYLLEASGWERPQWYDANRSLLDGLEIPVPNDWAARYWSPVVGAEALATRQRVGLYDLTSLRRMEVTGPGAVGFLRRLTTGRVDRSVGTVTYCLLLDHRGRIRGDITVARLGPEHFQLGLNGGLDLDWLTRHAPADGSVVLRDVTAGTCCLGVWGPRARDLVQRLTADDFSNEALRYFRGTRSYLGNVPVTALRLSYVGELGWELYTTADLGLRLWDTIWDAGQDLGVIAAGRGAFMSLRLEKGYRAFGTEMTNEHDPDEAGLGFAVRTGDRDYVGADALAERRLQPPERRLVCLTVADPTMVVMGKEPVYAGGLPTGYVTSGAYGYTVGCPIAYAWVPARLAEVGTEVEIGYFDRRVRATVAAEPLFDPEMKRLRS